MRGSIFVFAVVVSIATASPLALDPDVYRDMAEIVAARGYNLERHWVTTVDGYILGMFRIPRGRRSTSPGGQAILLQHALLDSSFSYVCNSPEESLGFVLADAGYDVWFGNNRGNTYSTNHTNLDVNSAAYWNFTFDEMGKYDLPAQVDYVRDTTGQDRIPYVGHSQGTIQAFAGFSINQTLSKHVSLFLAMAPVAYVRHQQATLFKIMAGLDVDRIFQLLGFKDFFPSGGIISGSSAIFCYMFKSICDDTMNAIAGKSVNLNASRIQVYVAHTPAGTSVKNLVHWAQGVREDSFAHYDGTPYKLADVNVPTALFVGGNDLLSDEEDVKRLVQELPPATLVKQWYNPTFAHLDPTWAVDAHDVLYPAMLELLRQYSPPQVADSAAILI